MKFNFSNPQPATRNPQTGQTLIETLAAIFILVMGITAAVGLAIYALNSSSSVTKQIIATGLAREGLEAVRNMRDTNWLKDTLSTDCYDFSSTPVGQPTAKCYKKWLGTNGLPTPFCLDPSNSGCDGGLPAGAKQFYSLSFDSSSANFWSLQPQPSTGGNYGLAFSGDAFDTNGIYYSDGTTPCADGPNASDYCRKIIISKDTDQPQYQQSSTGPLLIVESQVWWVDKTCPRVPDYDKANSACRIELDTYLTNWKNYQ